MSSTLTGREVQMKKGVRGSTLRRAVEAAPR